MLRIIWGSIAGDKVIPFEDLKLIETMKRRNREIRQIFGRALAKEYCIYTFHNDFYVGRNAGNYKLRMKELW